MTTDTLKVEGMSCGHCKKAVEGALTELEGVKTAEVNLDAETVKVEYDESQVGNDDFVAAVAEAGPYEVV